MDPEAIERLAARAERTADDVRRERQLIASAAAGARWESSAAGAFARRAGQVDRRLLRDADRLDELAAALGRHAEHVRGHQQLLTDLAHQADRLLQLGSRQ